MVKSAGGYKKAFHNILKWQHRDVTEFESKKVPLLSTVHIDFYDILAKSHFCFKDFLQYLRHQM